MTKLLPPAVGTVTLFGLYDATDHCYRVLDTAFADCTSFADFIHRFGQMNELERAGVYLYGGLGLISLVGLAVAVAAIVFRHIHHVGKSGHRLLSKRKPKTLLMMGVGVTLLAIVGIGFGIHVATSAGTASELGQNAAHVVEPHADLPAKSPQTAAHPTPKHTSTKAPQQPSVHPHVVQGRMKPPHRSHKNDRLCP